MSGPKVTITPNGARLVFMEDVEPEAVRWLWPGYVPLGKLTVIDGEPGLGKSAITLDLAARVTTGDVMPDGSASDLAGPAGVVLLSCEDGHADTIRPRLDAAGADIRRVVALDGKNLDGTTREDAEWGLPTLDDVDAICDAIEARSAGLVVVDPLMAYLPSKTDSNKDQHVRSVFGKLAWLAEDMGVAVVLVRHLNKGDGRNPLNRGGGSIGIVAAARSGLLVGKDPEDHQRRVLAVAKANLAALAPSLAYRIVRDGPSVRSQWEGESPYTANDLLGEPDQLDGGLSATGQAMAWLALQLSGGERPSRQVVDAAKAAGISAKVLQEARKRLGVERRQVPGGWIMWLPGGRTDPQIPLIPTPETPGIHSWEWMPGVSGVPGDVSHAVSAAPRTNGYHGGQHP